MTYEPVEHLKGYLERLPFDEGVLPWQQFLGLQPRQLKNATHTITKNLVSTLGREMSVRLTKGENVLIEKLGTGVTHETPLVLPSANVLPVLALTIPILLEDFKPQTLTDPLGKLLKDKHLKHPLVRGHESLSLLEILKDLPPTHKDIGILADPRVLQELGHLGDLAVYVINAVLGSHSAEAWLDGFLSAGMERTKLSTEGGSKVVTSLTELGYFTAAISHDTSASQLPPKSELFRLNSERFLFSWWFNCPQGRIDESQCLIPQIPAGTVFNLSPQLRIYVLPHLDLSLIIANHTQSPAGKEWTPTVAELVGEDRKIWKQFYSVVDPTFSEVEEEIEDEQMLATGRTIMWSVVVFLFFVIGSHIWVYGLFHLLWYILSLIKSAKFYAPRPQTAKKD